MSLRALKFFQHVRVLTAHVSADATALRQNDVTVLTRVRLLRVIAAYAPFVAVQSPLGQKLFATVLARKAHAAVVVVELCMLMKRDKPQELLATDAAVEGLLARVDIHVIVQQDLCLEELSANFAGNRRFAMHIPNMNVQIVFKRKVLVTVLALKVGLCFMFADYMHLGLGLGEERAATTLTYMVALTGVISFGVRLQERLAGEYLLAEIAVVHISAFRIVDGSFMESQRALDLELGRTLRALECLVIVVHRRLMESHVAVVFEFFSADWTRILGFSARLVVFRQQFERIKVSLTEVALVDTIDLMPTVDV